MTRFPVKKDRVHKAKIKLRAHPDRDIMMKVIMRSGTYLKYLNHISFNPGSTKGIDADEYSHCWYRSSWWNFP